MLILHMLFINLKRFNVIKTYTDQTNIIENSFARSIFFIFTFSNIFISYKHISKKVRNSNIQITTKGAPIGSDPTQHKIRFVASGSGLPTTSPSRLPYSDSPCYAS